MTWLLILAVYVAVPLASLKITGRQLEPKGIFLFVLLWPIAWLFMGPEELP